jgi:hypothetical protein
MLFFGFLSFVAKPDLLSVELSVSAVAQDVHSARRRGVGHPGFGQKQTIAQALPPRILLAALVSLLIQALEDEETRHLASDELRDDLRTLLAHVEDELDGASQPRHLHLAGDEASGMSDD